MRQAWGEQEMHFEDPYAQKVFNERLGRLTLNRVRKITAFPHKNGHNLDFLFADSTEIEKFEEIKHFVSLNNMNKTFSNCPNLKGTLTIPTSVRSVGGGCFYKTSLIGIEFLSHDFFWYTGMIHSCPLLKWVIMHAPIPPKNTYANPRVFGNEIGQDNWKLYVPDDSVTAYRENVYYSYLGDRIRPISEFKE